MTAGTLAWGITFAVLCVLTGITIGWPIGHARGLRHAAEDDAEAAYWQPDGDDWARLADEPAQPEPPWPPAPPQPPRTGPGKHRHPSGPPRHAELPAAGRLPATDWGGTTLTLPAPVQAPPWEQPEPEPAAQVLEPTAVLPPDPGTDTAWNLVIAAQAADMDRWLAENIGATDSTLKAITK